MEPSSFFTMANTKMGGATLDPRALQMQQYSQLQQAQLQHAQHTKGSQAQIQPMQSQMHNFFQVQPQGSSVLAAKPAPKPRTKKESKSSGSVTSSDSDLDIEEEEPEPMPEAITTPKPSDEKGKLLWEVVEAVWTPRNKPAPAEKMRSAITYVGNAIRGLRDKWKQANEQLKQAELPNQAGTRNLAQIEALKMTVSSYRDTMEKLAANVTKYGHSSILRRYVLLFQYSSHKCIRFSCVRSQRTRSSQSVADRGATPSFLIVAQSRYSTMQGQGLALLVLAEFKMSHVSLDSSIPHPHSVSTFRDGTKANY